MSAKTMTLKQFSKELEGNKKVIIKQDLLFVWHGGHTINIYSALTGTSLDCFNVGNFQNDKATLEQVEKGINDYVKEVK